MRRRVAAPRPPRFARCVVRRVPRGRYSTAPRPQYYDIPSPSLRNAIYPALQADVPPFKRSKVHTEGWEDLDGNELAVAGEAERADYFFTDVIHPADQGHAALAELLADVLRTAARNVAAAGGHAAVLRRQAAQQLQQRRQPEGAEGQRAAAVLQPPMVPGNADRATSLCAMQDDFRGVASAMRGFEWVAEKPRAKAHADQKWGYRTYDVGGWIELEFRTGAVGSEERVMVLLAHLRSYHGMGLARVECVSGCECEPTLFDGWWKAKTSLTQLHKFTASQHPRCRVRVTGVPRGPGDESAEMAAAKGGPFSVGGKVQLNGVMVSISQPDLWAYPSQMEDLLGAARAG